MSNKEMISVIECFVHHRTGEQIRLTMPRTPQQYLLLTQAYEKCLPYFIKH
jgi:hypothetical protein